MAGSSDAIPVVLMALGGVDGRIHLHVQQRDLQFTSVLQLEGHQDWVRSLAFTTTEAGELLLASASQDSYVPPSVFFSFSSSLTTTTTTTSVLYLCAHA